MTEWSIAFIVSTALAATGFVYVAVLWLKKLRETLVIALGETAAQQIRSAQRLSETIAKLQRQQHQYEQKIQVLTEASLRVRHDLDDLSGKIEMTERDTLPNPTSRMIH